MKNTLLAASLAAALALGTAHAQAQSSPDPHQHDQPAAEGASPGDGTLADPMMQMMSGMMKMMHGQGGMAGMGMAGMPGMGMADHVEGRIAFLHAELKISDEQEKLWADFADALRETATSRAQASGHGGAAKADAGIVGALKAQTAMLEARLASAKRLSTALDPLYAALSDEQKKLADDLIGMQIGMAGAMMGGMMPGKMGGANQ